MSVRKLLIVSLMLISGLLFSIPNQHAAADPPVVIDDFEDGDASDWGFFGGNGAGGGGGVLDDRPQEGAYYLSTGWGGGGSASGFYGGFFKNLPDNAQVMPPVDAWFTVWVLNQSDATVDQFALEITLREDTDGNGWTDGAEDSVRLDVPFTAADFNDTWTQVSAPLSSFSNLGTGGDGSFNGLLDEIVVVVSGVQGADGATVEVDFDQFAFSTGGTTASDVTVFDDMEHGDPFNNGWFAFGGAVGGGGIGANSVDLPPQDGGLFSLETGWGSGGVAGFYGGFGRTSLTDLDGRDYFNFWINPDPGQEYTLEINLQEDDNGDDAANAADDDEFQFNCVVSAAGPCAVSGAGWQQISIPLADFFDDNSFFTGGNGVLDPVAAANGGNGQLVNIVFAVIGSGTDVNFRTDYWVFSTGSLVEPSVMVDDFEAPLASGVDGDGNDIGFYTFNDPNSTVSFSTTTTPPAPVPGAPAGNSVLQVDSNVNSNNGFAGVTHAFENETVDTWVTQDWSQFEGISFWLYGSNTGSTLFIDVQDNRAPDTTGDTAERYSLDIIDNFSGWQFFEIPFASLNRKEVGNGAPNDGLNLTQVHGWAFGVFNAGQPLVNYIDDVALYGVAELPPLAVGFTVNNYEVTEGDTGQVIVALNRALGDEDPDQVTVNYAVETVIAEQDRDFATLPSGTLTFEKGGASELSFSVETLDDAKYEGTERLILRLSEPTNADPGFIMQAALSILDNETFNPALLDDFEKGAFLWESPSGLLLSTPEYAAGEQLAPPGTVGYETILSAAPLSGDSPREIHADVLQTLRDRLPEVTKNPDRWHLRRAIFHLSVGERDKYWQNDYYLVAKFGNPLMQHHSNAVNALNKLIMRGSDPTGEIADAISSLLQMESDLVTLKIQQAVLNDGDARKLAAAQQAQANAEAARADGNWWLAARNYQRAWLFANLAVKQIELDPVQIRRDFPLGEDWSLNDGLRFMFYGQGTGETVTVDLLDNRAPDPGPSGWSLIWSDEFNDPAGTPPNPAHWSYEIGDGTVNGIPGWGNDELQYYTDSSDNVATDGQGNLVITAREADDSLVCYYGPCEYTSARLISADKVEVAYGRIESRVLVPDGAAGLWPAFWSLGTDINEVGWPQTGEIDIMEYVSRLPEEIFGTIHGPGYSGGQSYGDIYPFPGGVATDYHTFAIEWQPDRIEWYVDDILYHTATPADVAPNEWVFNDPVFLLFNMALGGNFGGAVSPDLTMPQEMVIDYVRVYQGPDTAERFEATFVDDFVGWQEVTVPFDAFSRSAAQPDGAPDDGLTLTDVWGYGFSLPADGALATLVLDQVVLSAPTAVTVTNLNDNGPGSLREAVAIVASAGEVTFDSALAGGTVNLTSGPIVLNKAITVDATAASGITLSGGGVDRVLVVEASGVATVRGLTLRDGYGFQLGGGVINNGSLTLEQAAVINNTMTTDAGDFWQGGGGIYNGENATLNLIDSTVADNASGWTGGGIYSFFNSTTNIIRSTVSGNVSADVGGGLRVLGNGEIVNSTLSGNSSTAWHGGALFLTDGGMTMLNSTVVGNQAPAGTTGGLFVGTFTDASASLTIENSIVANNGDFGCFLAPFGGGAVSLESLGSNLFTDATCGSATGDLVVADPGVGPLADNGGPTLTHALLAGSPAIDGANPAVCPAVDQRGVTRDAACDIGSFEWAP